jgi:hypothetical protein
MKTRTPLEDSHFRPFLPVDYDRIGEVPISKEKEYQITKA